MRRPLLLVWIMLLWGGTVIEAQQNLVRNPGFEDPPLADGQPGGGWWLYQGQGETDAHVDRSVAHGGLASVKLHAAGQAKAALASAPFAVAPGDEIRFQAWMRAENLAPEQSSTYLGLAFRDADGRVFQHAYYPTYAASGDWRLVSGVAVTPEGATMAEVHLGYTNAPGTLWFDDVSAFIANPLSFSLLQGTKPWAGPQEPIFVVVNRATNLFRGQVCINLSGRTNSVVVGAEPGASEQVKVPVIAHGQRRPQLQNPPAGFVRPADTHPPGQVHHPAAAGPVSRLPLLSRRRRGQRRHTH